MKTKTNKQKAKQVSSKNKKTSSLKTKNKTLKQPLSQTPLQLFGTIQINIKFKIIHMYIELIIFLFFFKYFIYPLWEIWVALPG